MAQPVWSPTAEQIEKSNITAFMRSENIGSLEALWDLARTDIAGFYDRLLTFIGLSWFEPYRAVLDLSRGVPFARWFSSGRYNASHNCLDKHV
ncbi:MAG TPA: acetyl-coenzyme A synthetase N-terminal domain-containing protein, partial [Candidatus Eremiobacteraceae bacterium]